MICCILGVHICISSYERSFLLYTPWLRVYFRVSRLKTSKSCPPRWITPQNPFLPPLCVSHLSLLYGVSNPPLLVDRRCVRSVGHLYPHPAHPHRRQQLRLLLQEQVKWEQKFVLREHVPGEQNHILQQQVQEEEEHILQERVHREQKHILQKQEQEEQKHIFKNSSGRKGAHTTRTGTGRTRTCTARIGTGKRGAYSSRTVTQRTEAYTAKP